MTGVTKKVSQKLITTSLQTYSVALRGTTEKYISPQKRAYLEKNYSPTDFKPTFKCVDTWGRARWKAPRISRRKLNDMRKNCEYLNIDPQEIGLPVKPEKKPLRIKPNKGKKHERNAPERKAKVAKALIEMPQTIETWRLEKQKEKEKSKSSLPF